MVESRFSGYLLGLGAFLLWGLMPLYFKAVAHLDTFDVLAHRVLWTLPIAAFVVVVLGERSAVRDALTHWRKLAVIAFSALLVTTNWGIYIWAVAHGRILEASLGYFITPLVVVALGVLLFGERLRFWQWVAIALATLGVLQLLVVEGIIPWVGLGLALTFGLYSALRKRSQQGSAGGLFLETLLIAPLAGIWASILFANETSGFVHGGTATTALLLFAGVVTAVPLLLYVAASRRLPMTSMGILFFLTPTILFLVATLVYQEAVTSVLLITFGFIWLGILIHLLESRWR
jgi:chloramphenicol-sensitive protein RarD